MKNRIEEIRKERGIKQDDFAKAMGEIDDDDDDDDHEGGFKSFFKGKKEK